MYKFLFLHRIKSFLKYFKHNRFARITTLCLFLFVYVLIYFGVYKFFEEGFRYIAFDKYFSAALNLYLIEMTLLLVSILVFFSSLITAIYSIFRSRQESFIIYSPRYKSLLGLIFRRLVFSSFWPILLIILPVFTAMGKVFGTNLVASSKSLLLVLLLLAFIAGIAMLVVLSLAWLLSKINVHELGNALKLRNMFLLVLVLGVVVMSFTWTQAIDHDLIHLFRATNLNQEVLDYHIIENQFKYFPSNIAALGIFYNIDNNLHDSNPCLLALLAMAALMIIMYKLLGKIFLPLWQRLSEGNYTAESEKLIHSRGRKKVILFSGSQTTAVFKKEALMATRNSRGLFWFGFLVLVWLAQTGMNIVLGKNIAQYGLGDGGFPALAEALQFVTTLFFISAFVLRFAFPSFSSEKRTAWVLYSAPVNFSKIYLAKFLFYLTTFSILGILVGYLNLHNLDLPISYLGITFFAFLSGIFLTTSYGMLLGARFPNFNTDDPSILSTTLPGLAFMFGALGYAAYGAWLLYQMASSASFLSISAYIIFSIILGVLFVLVSTKSRRSVDYLTIS